MRQASEIRDDLESNAPTPATLKRFLVETLDALGRVERKLMDDGEWIKEIPEGMELVPIEKKGQD